MDKEVWPIKTFLWLLVMGALILCFDYLGWLKPAKVAVEWPLKPMRQAVLNIKRTFDGGTEMVRSVAAGKQRIADLERQVAQLTVDATLAKSLVKENETLRKWQKLPLSRSFTGVPVTIVGQGEEMLAWGGKNEGLKEGQAVVSAEGILLGKVDEVGERVTRIRLLTQPVVEVAVVTEAGALGKVKGDGQKVILEDILQAETLEVGMRILTRGSDSLPPGILVGTVTKVHEIHSEVYKTAELAKLTDLKMMDYVLVVIENNE